MDWALVLSFLTYALINRGLRFKEKGKREKWQLAGKI